MVGLEPSRSSEKYSLVILDEIYVRLNYSVRRLNLPFFTSLSKIRFKRMRTIKLGCCGTKLLSPVFLVIKVVHISDSTSDDQFPQ